MLKKEPVKSRFDFIERLSKSHNSEIYKVRNRKTGSFNAIKMFYTDSPGILIDRDDFLVRWKKLCKYGKKLKHPNILSILENGYDRKEMFYFYITDYIEGKKLNDADFCKNISFIQKMAIAQDIISGIKYAHSKSILHRDIKPSNILIDDDENKAFITDFDSAKFEEGTNTNPGYTLGTPEFMSPEQIRGEKLDHRSDIFALGSLLYYLFTCNHPFKGKNVGESMNRVLYTTPQQPGKYCSELPVSINIKILKMLEKKRETRENNLDSILISIKQILAKEKKNPKLSV